MRFPPAWLDWIAQQQIIAVIRHADPAIALKMADAAIAGGIHCLEITWTCAQAPELIRQLRQTYPQCSVGTGTIMTGQQLEQAIAAGAEFIFSPHTSRDLIAQSVAAQVAVIPGALTPTEIVSAWELGATAVKVFPISSCGGGQYLESIRPVLSHIPLIPTGGVTLNNAIAFLNSGAIAVGLAGDLFPQAIVQAQNWPEITRRAAQLRAGLSVKQQAQVS